MENQVLFVDPAAESAGRMLTAAEASAVGGGTISGILPDMFWRYPLPQPIAPMPPKAIPVPLDPVEMTETGNVLVV